MAYDIETALLSTHNHALGSKFNKLFHAQLSSTATQTGLDPACTTFGPPCHWGLIIEDLTYIKGCLKEISHSSVSFLRSKTYVLLGNC